MQSQLKSKLLLVFLLMTSLLSGADEHSNLFVKYGKVFSIPPEILWGIAKVESDFNPMAINKNKNGTYDLGLMQINTVHLPELKKFGLNPQDLFYPETSVAFGAHVLSKCFEKYGQNWKGLTCYNGRIEGNDYAQKVLTKILRELKSGKNSDIAHVALSN